MCTRYPPFSNRTSSPWCSTLAPRNPNSIAPTVPPGVGSAAGDEDGLTVNGMNAGLPLPVTLSATHAPGVSTVCAVPGAAASKTSASPSAVRAFRSP